MSLLDFEIKAMGKQRQIKDSSPAKRNLSLHSDYSGPYRPLLHLGCSHLCPPFAVPIASSAFCTQKEEKPEPAQALPCTDLC